MIRVNTEDGKTSVEVTGNYETLAVEIVQLVKQFAEHPQLRSTLIAAINVVNEYLGGK